MPIVVIAKNTSINELDVGSLGIRIPTSGQRNLTDMVSLGEITDSQDLKDLVIAATIIINDGISDLSPANGLKHISFQTEYVDAVEEAQIIVGGGGVTKEYVTAMAIALGS